MWIELWKKNSELRLFNHTGGESEVEKGHTFFTIIIMNALGRAAMNAPAFARSFGAAAKNQKYYILMCTLEDNACNF